MTATAAIDLPRACPRDGWRDEFRGILAQQLAKPIKRRGRRIGALSFEVNIEYVAN